MVCSSIICINNMYTYHILYNMMERTAGQFEKIEPEFVATVKVSPKLFRFVILNGIVLFGYLAIWPGFLCRSLGQIKNQLDFFLRIQVFFLNCVSIYKSFVSFKSASIWLSNFSFNFL